MPLNTQPYKGARDFYPEDKRKQKFMFDKLRQVVETFGYEEYDGPILESLDIYLAKTGQEIVNEQTYSFEDRSQRKVVIRPEMTPTVSRMVAAKRNVLTFPLRLYSIPNLWRYERPQRGRYREHWQLNVDLFGEASINAEIEIINLASSIYKSYGATSEMYTIHLNSRQLIDYLMKDILKLEDQQALSLVKLIDRMNKIDIAEFDKLAEEVVEDPDKIKLLNQVLSTNDIEDLPEELISNNNAKKLNDLIKQLHSELDIDNIVFDPSLMRGFDYYNDIVFEIFDTHPDNNRSMMGGGRYDGLVGLFGVEPVATVGFGLGDATLQNFLELHDLLPVLRPETDLAVLLIGDINNKSQKLLKKLRDQGLNISVDFSDRKLGNKIKWAESKNIQYICPLGINEINSKLLTIKDLQTGEQQLVPVDDVIYFLDKDK
jgi:histidyl-tRNA synthetase